MTVVFVTVNYRWYGLHSKVLTRSNYVGHALCIRFYCSSPWLNVILCLIFCLFLFSSQNL